MAVLDVLESENLQANAQRTGDYLMDKTRDLADKYPLIGDVRGLGLFIGIELVNDRESLDPAARQTAYIVNRMRELGLLISSEGPQHNVLKIKPPLVFNRGNANLFLDLFEKLLCEDAAQPV
jgi:4-aminobutyrate aminotransferase-like enzyme